MVFDIRNCFVCNTPPVPTRNSIRTKSGSSETPINLLLEQMLNITFEKSDLVNFILCQECFLYVEKFDDLQQQADEVQNNLALIYSNSRIEEVFIKAENENSSTVGEMMDQIDDLDTASTTKTKLKLTCKKCKLIFSSVTEMINHSHDVKVTKNLPHLIMKRKSEQPIKERQPIVSRQFKKIVKEEGINYTLDAFQNAFYSQKEKVEKRPPEKLKVDKAVITSLRPQLSIEKLDAGVSENFKECVKKQGIKYDLETFQRAFGVNDSEKPRELPAVKLKRKALVSNELVVKKLCVGEKADDNFVKTMKENGVNYDLKSFQRAFGFVDSTKDDDDDSVEEDENTSSDGFTDSNQKVQTIKCPHCDVTTSSRASYKKHLKIHQAKVPDHYCSECKLQFRCMDSFRVHTASDHGRVNGPLTCPICKKIYPDKSGLKTHLYYHREQKDILCGVCGATFACNRMFKSHSLQHIEVKPYPCTYEGCEKRFRNIGKLNIHLRVHTGETLFECPFCPPGKRFKQKWGMDLHINKHHKASLKPELTCMLCDARTQCREKLEKHMELFHQIVTTNENE